VFLSAFFAQVLNAPGAATVYRAIDGDVQTIDAALDSAPRSGPNALILYENKDKIIRKESPVKFLAGLPVGAEGQHRLKRYEIPYHTLRNNLGANRIWNDILARMTRGD